MPQERGGGDAISGIAEADRLGNRLRSGIALVIVAVFSDLAGSYVLDRARVHVVLPYDLFTIAACLAAAGLSYTRGFPERWKEITLATSVFVVGAVTVRGAMLGDQVSALVAIIALMAASCALLPWETKWQRGLTAPLIAAAVADTLLVRPMSDYIALLWLMTLATAALTLARERLWPQRQAAGRERRPEEEPRLYKVLGADVGQVAMVQLRGARFVNVNEELIANLSHELRTSLDGIMGMADLLADSPLNPEQRGYLETILIDGGSLLDLIDVILDLSKVESGKLRLEEGSFELDDVIQNVVEATRTRANEKRLELAVRIKPDVPLSLSGDRLRLRQVLINLLDNAVKFTEHGEILLTVEVNEISGKTTDLRFTVRDTGIGIAADNLETIFQAFTRGDPSTARHYGGTGLGLAITKRLVQLMGGKIWVESARGKGSVFHFTALFGLRSDATRPELPGAEKLNGMRVLVVGENEMSRSVLRELLREQAAEVVEADSGEHALDELDRARGAGTPYGLALVDGAMRVMDGFAMVEALRQQSGGTEPVVLMLTSDNLDAQLARLRQAQIAAYLVKPVVKRTDLIGAIELALAGKPTLAEPQTAPAAAPAASKSQAPAMARSLRILFADDSPHNRLLIKEFLKDLPLELDMAENGEIALDKFTHASYDLVLMDLRMPVMDGYTAVRRIRLWEQERNRPATPVIALSASALEDDVRESIEAGCTAHLSKPVKRARLRELIHQLASKPAPAASPAGSEPAAAEANSAHHSG